MTGRNINDVSMSDLWNYLRIALSCVAKAYCIIDALDEMDQDHLEPFLQSLNKISQWRPHEIKFIMTSRPVATVERVMRKLSVIDVRLRRHLVEKDIEFYVQNRLHTSSIPPTDREEVKRVVLEKADGIFLYAGLAMNTVLRPGADLQRALRDLPANLTVMYATLLEEHSNRSGVPEGLLMLVLQCVTHATRPLRLLELADLVNSTRLEKQDLGETKNLIRSLCGPLIEILPDETTRVVHHSLTEYLNGTSRGQEPGNFPVFEPEPTHYRLALLCLSYLDSGCLEQVSLTPPNPPFSGPGLEPNALLPPFAQYASGNWHVHLKKAGTAGGDEVTAIDMLHRLFVETI
jgi:hypothetical protein